MISWPALIEAVSKEKITLGAALEKAHGEPKGSGFVIRFVKSFDLESAKRASAILETALARLAGRPVALELELGAAPIEATTTEIVDRGMPEPATGAAAPPGTKWKEIGESSPDGAPASGGLKNAEGVFGGKARIIKKKSGE